MNSTQVHRVDQKVRGIKSRREYRAQLHGTWLFLSTPYTKYSYYEDINEHRAVSVALSFSLEVERVFAHWTCVDGSLDKIRGADSRPPRSLPFSKRLHLCLRCSHTESTGTPDALVSMGVDTHTHNVFYSVYACCMSTWCLRCF